MNGNDFVRLALRSPVHVLMGDTMSITVTGRKSGRKITLPMNFYRDGDTLWVISSRGRTWWRNLVQGAQVDLHLHGHDLKGFGEAVLDEAAVAAQIGAYARRLPASVRDLGVRLQEGVPNAEDIVRVAKERVFVRICVEA